jgi:hypothetical protein
LSSGQETQKKAHAAPPVVSVDSPVVDATTQSGTGASNDQLSPRDQFSRTKSLPGRDRDMGSALRSVYQETVSEAVPDDLLDLLGKLN